MLAPKVDKKKNTIMAAVIVLILCIIGFMLMKNAGFFTSEEGGDGSLLPKSDSAEKTIALPKLNTQIFSFDVFRKMKEEKYNETDIKDLEAKAGKKNPFYVEPKKVMEKETEINNNPSNTR